MKRLLFSLYVAYQRAAPWSLGKGFLNRVVASLGPVTYKVDGALMELNPGAWIDRTLVAGEAHDPLVGRTLRQCLSRGGVFLDIGANIGVFTLAAAQMPDVTVYSFEPSPRELPRLYRHLALNGVKNVVVFPFALGRTSEKLKMSLGWSGNPGTNSFVTSGHDAATVVCQCVPLDSILTSEIVRQVKVVKMDIEGFEMEALRGMTESIAGMGPVTFVVEVTRSLLQRAGSSAEELYGFFAERGFSSTLGLQEHDQWDEAFVKSA